MINFLTHTGIWTNSPFKVYLVSFHLIRRHSIVKVRQRKLFICQFCTNTESIPSKRQQIIPMRIRSDFLWKNMPKREKTFSAFSKAKHRRVKSDLFVSLIVSFEAEAKLLNSSSLASIRQTFILLRTKALAWANGCWDDEAKSSCAHFSNNKNNNAYSAEEKNIREKWTESSLTLKIRTTVCEHEEFFHPKNPRRPHFRQHNFQFFFSPFHLSLISSFHAFTTHLSTPSADFLYAVTHGSAAALS